MLFALSCSGIWIGLFNSIQEICKERVIVKREYMANLKLPGYVLSKFVFQAVLGAVQSLLLTGIFLALVGKNPRGVFLDSFIPEMMLTVWLTVLASVALGLTVSAVVKTGDKGMTVAPFPGRSGRGDFLCDCQQMVRGGAGKLGQAEQSGPSDAGGISHAGT